MTYGALGLPPDPWADLDVNTADAARTAQMVQAAADARAFVSIVGPRGAGKTCAVRRALERIDARVVEPLRVSRDQLHLGDIETAIVRDLSDERVRRSGEARSEQVRRILRAVGSRQRIVLLIDDAHVLHHQTVRGLKRLRELGAVSRRGVVLGIVLVGQSDRTERAAEVRLRSDRLTFAGLTTAEARAAVDRAMNRDRELVAADALAELVASERARNWLDLEALVDECLTEAVMRGANRVDSACVGAVLNPGDHSAGQPKAPRGASQAAVGAILREGAA